MKTRFTLACLMPAVLLFSPLNAQIVLEHQYSAGIGSRLLLDGTTERYVTIANPSAGLAIVNWYDSTHQLVQTTDVAVPTTVNSATLRVPYATTYVVDSDTEIEFVLAFTDATGPRHRLIDPAVGQLGPDYIDPPTIFSVDGVSKLLYDNTVYLLPGLGADHVFTLSSTPVGRTVLELDGPKFWYDDDQGNLQFVNEDYTPYQTLVNVLDVDAGCTQTIRVYGQLSLDPNAAIEWSLQQSCIDSTTFTYFSGDTPFATFRVPGSSSFLETMLTPDRYPELDHPVATAGRLSGQLETYFFNLGTSMIEHYEPGFWLSRAGTDDIGLKYTPLTVAAASTAVNVLDADYSVWKAFPKVSGASYAPSIPGALLYDGDASTAEILGRGVTPNLPINNNGYHVQRDDGTVLFTVDTANRSSFTYLAGRQNKLLISRNDLGDPALNFTRVYALPSFTSPVAEPTPAPVSWTFGAYPNPVLDVLRLELPARSQSGIVHVRNAAGRDVYRQRLTSGQAQLYVPSADWSPGVYTVDVQFGTERVVRRVVKP